jgi:hypothetical protein
LRADWTLPADERFLPLVQFIGWKPERDALLNCPSGATAAGMTAALR